MISCTEVSFEIPAANLIEAVEPIKIVHQDVCLDANCYGNCPNLHYKLGQTCSCYQRDCPSTFPGKVRCTTTKKCTFGAKCRSGVLGCTFVHNDLGLCLHGYTNGECPYHQKWIILNTYDNPLKLAKAANISCKNGEDCVNILQPRYMDENTLCLSIFCPFQHDQTILDFHGDLWTRVLVNQNWVPLRVNGTIEFKYKPNMDTILG
jgi:hypothetical protein